MRYFLVFILVISFILMIYAFNQSKKIKVGSILFIGDSNTASATSYADQLQRDYPNLRIKKVAKNGAQTSWMLPKLYEELALKEYDLVVILGGSNDVYGLNENNSAKINLDSMYKMAKEHGSNVIAVTPPNKNFYINRTDTKQVLLKDLVYFIKQNKNVDKVLDFYSITNDISYFNPSDGYLHAGPEAHRLLKNKLKSEIKVN